MAVAGHCAASGVGLLYEVFLIISTNARPAGGGVVEVASEGIVFEANRPAAAWKRHTGQPVLEFPNLGCRARKNSPSSGCCYLDRFLWRDEIRL